MMRFRLTCAHGLEGSLVDELHELGFAQVEHRAGSVLVEASIERLGDLHRSRMASRVWMILAEAVASIEERLIEAAQSVDWSAYRWAGDPLSVVVAGGAFDAVDALRLAIDAQAVEGEGGSVVKLRIAEGWAGLELDCSGADMHQRGYRLDAQSAPLDENYAVACLRAAEWRVGEPLYDPCCGPGAFVIEAALMGLSSSRLRPWRFASWPSSPAMPQDDQKPLPPAGLLMASDQAFAAYNACRDHADRAGVLKALDLHRKPLEDMDLSALHSSGLVTAYPPYGTDQRGDVVRRLLARFHGTLAGWRLALLVPQGVGRPHGNLESRLSFMHAGQRVVLWVGYPVGAP